ncbi:2OG-Fe dioxygenase family protein [Nocardiopsis gilva]|uniref:2OG-Fe dioxygenase family protein n=1 Tax=Nocardiopsis gilva TaxID=280236 RepID=UPI0003475B86|nr:2OG-Fe dioxygenase family protein [Nocardiopsis gilva]
MKARFDTTTTQVALAEEGVCLLPPDTVNAALGIEPSRWTRFAAHWDDLADDPYVAAHGTRRQRRYDRFSLTPANGELDPLPHTPFIQPGHTNPLYPDVERHFAPLTAEFQSEPLMRALLLLLGRLASALDDAATWTSYVHPMRVIASADSQGDPTPEGRHRDGVTLVTSFFVGRRNATGGTTTVVTSAGEPLLTTALDQPGTLLLCDDRRTLHQVSAIQPTDPARPAFRDALVTTLVPA